MTIDLLTTISITANIATIIGLIVSVISLRKSVKQCENKIDRLFITKAGVIISPKIMSGDIHVHDKVVQIK